jgi:DHA1 family bicyclomycin/chloramphenicol resistance-like MFS transporter
MTSRSLTDDSPWLLVILASLVALGPLTIDTYLPALPGMVREFGVDNSRVQLTISSFLLGFALFHLVCGPLADRYGRKPIALGGLALYLCASIGCATSQNIEQLILWRFLQGIGACVGPTLGRAMARDIFGPRKAARALAQIAMIMALAPAIAPTLGGLLLEFFHWSSIFYALLIYGLLTTATLAVYLPESLPNIQPLNLPQIGRNYLQLLSSSHYLYTTCASSLIYAGMISFLSGSSFIFIDMMGVAERYYGLTFLSTVAGYIAGSAASTRLSSSRESEQVMWLGVQISVLSAVAMCIAPEFWFHPASIVVPMSFFAASLGIILPHAMAAALRPFPHMAATASALLGFIQMGLSSLAGAVVGYFLVDSTRPMTGVILGLSLLSWCLIARLQSRPTPA